MDLSIDCGLINSWQDDIFSRKYIVWHMVSCLNLYYWYQSHHLTNMLDDNMPWFMNYVPVRDNNALWTCKQTVDLLIHGKMTYFPGNILFGIWWAVWTYIIGISPTISPICWMITCRDSWIMYLLEIIMHYGLVNRLWTY